MVIRYYFVQIVFLLSIQLIQPIQAQEIVITPEELDFGDVAAGETVELEFTLENTDEFEEFLPYITVFPADPEHFSLNWAGERGEATRVMNVIRSICNAILTYRQDFAEDPSSIEQLLEDGYLEIPEQVSTNWNFTFVGRNPICQIEAISTDEMPDGAGQLILFDLLSGRFEGYGTPLGDPQAPLRAMETLRSISNAVMMYHQDYGEYPVSVERLVSEEYMFIPVYIDRKWDFEFIGEDPITGIEAISTDEMRGGMGHVIRYDIESDSFSGYRIPYQEFFDWLWGGIWWEYSTLTLSVTFQPSEEREYSSEVLVRVVNERGQGQVDTLHIPVNGNGIMSVSRIPEIADKYILMQAYPNPFNSATTIKYTVPLITSVTLEVFDINGRLIEMLVDGVMSASAGLQSVVWDAGGVGAGVYFVRMKGENDWVKGIEKVTFLK